MKRVDGYECEKCCTFYLTAEEATTCENEHTKIEEVQIIGLNYNCLHDKHGVSHSFNKKIPDSIQVKIFGTPARYKLEHYGMRGV